MKKIIMLICLMGSISVNATINRLSNGVTYCISQYGGNFKVDWKHNIIILTLAGSDTYKIIKEAKDSKNKGIVLTARKYFWKDKYIEFKIYSSPSGDFFRAQDKDTKEYPYHTATLSCWDEQ